MTTLYVNRLAVIVPASNVEGMSQLAAVVGEIVSFPIPLSVSGAEPATHYGMSTVASNKMCALLTRAIPYPEDVDPAIADALLDTMELSRNEAPVIETEVDGELLPVPHPLPRPAQHFNAFLTSLNLQIIQKESV